MASNYPSEPALSQTQGNSPGLTAEAAGAMSGRMTPNTAGPDDAGWSGEVSSALTCASCGKTIPNGNPVYKGMNGSYDSMGCKILAEKN